MNRALYYWPPNLEKNREKSKKKINKFQNDDVSDPGLVQGRQMCESSYRCDVSKVGVSLSPGVPQPLLLKGNHKNQQIKAFRNKVCRHFSQSMT